MATASRGFPFFVLIETRKGHKFYSSYQTQAEADADAVRLNAIADARPEKERQQVPRRAYVVTKAEGDEIVEDKAAPEPPPAEPEQRQSLDIVADKSGGILLKIDKASLSRFLSSEDADKVQSLQAGESLRVDTDAAAVSEITKGEK